MVFITGNLAQAELIGKEALKILPKDHTIMFSLANVLGKQEKYKVTFVSYATIYLSVFLLQTHISETFSHTQIYYRQKTTHVLLFSQESEAFFLSALKINPNVASCHGNLGKSFRDPAGNSVLSQKQLFKFDFCNVTRYRHKSVCFESINKAKNL